MRRLRPPGRDRAEPARAILLYDRDCGFCRWSLQRVLGWDRRQRLQPLALQDPAADTLLAHLEARERMESWHLVTADGRVRSAGAAVEPLLRMLPGGAPLAALAAAFPWLTNAAYVLVARNRSTLSRLLAFARQRR